MLLRFGPFEVDSAREELRRAGLVLHLPPQPFRILVLLIQRAGDIVTRDEIQSAVWGESETFVDFERGINSAIRQIRSVLGDNAESPRYIRTLPRRGYSFVGTVERAARPSAEALAIPAIVPALRRRFGTRAIASAVLMIVALATVIVAVNRAQRPVVAKRPGRVIEVLPFLWIGPPATGVDARSFAEELRVVMGKLPPQRVRIFDAEGAGAPGDARPPDVVIEGTIRHVDGGLRVIVSAVDTASKTQLWSKTFDRPADRKDRMAFEVAHRVMQEMARRFLPPSRREPLLVTRASPQAVSLYRRARLEQMRPQKYDWMRARALFEEALRKDQRFAEAWSGLGDVWTSQVLHGPASDRSVAAAHAARCARRALALQPRNAEALSTLALLASQHDYDLATAEDALRQAVAADSGYLDARANLSMVLTMRGQPDESLAHFSIAQQLDPAMYDLSLTEPVLYLHARRFDDARAQYADFLIIDPESRAAMWGLLSTHVAQENWSEAIALTARLGEVPTPPGVLPTEEGFQQFYRILEPLVNTLCRRGVFNDYSAAIYFAQAGDRDRAFERLHRAIDARVPSVSYIIVDPRLDNLRRDPRFDALVARTRLGQPPSSR